MKKSKRKTVEFHGLSRHPLYRRWCAARNRCINPKNPQYKDYGARGIKMCDEWIESPRAFFDYMMTLPHAMQENHTVDRVNNDQGYKPGNMKWSTMSEQIINGRNRYKSKGKDKRCMDYYGVSIHKYKCKIKVHSTRFTSTVGTNRKRYRLGIFSDPKEAALARDRFIIDNGLSHPLNFPTDS